MRIRLFASYRESAGTARLEQAVAAGTSVGQLTELLAERIASLKTAKGMVAVNQEYVTREHVLHDGDEVAFIPPVSGG